MLFNSPEFFVFFAIVYALYRLLGLRGQNVLLLIAGYVFYGWWDVRFLFLIAFSTTVDFWIGLMLGEGRVPMRERFTASAFIVAAALAFLCVDWHAVAVSGVAAIVHPSPLGLRVLAGTIVVALLANLTHGRVAAMEPRRRRRLLLFTTVFVNLGFLATFKYFNFFVGSAEAALRAAGYEPSHWHLDVVLPVGISFYTFQSLSYTIDVGRERIRPAHRFWDFALFVAFFPPMVAGPIERARHLLPQLQRPRTIRLRAVDARRAADPVRAVQEGRDRRRSRRARRRRLQLDRHGFDAGRGAGDAAVRVPDLLRLLGLYRHRARRREAPRHRADDQLRPALLLAQARASSGAAGTSACRRWLRDYLYISLGGNRKGEGRTYANLMATMALGGLWHGAAWNYVLWGVYQGALLCGHRLLTGRQPELATMQDAIEHRHRRPFHAMRRVALDTSKILFFFIFVCYGWLLFRANSFGQIVGFSQTMFGVGPTVPSVMPRPVLPAVVGLGMLVFLQIADYRSGRSESFRFWPRPAQGALYASMIFVLAMGTSNAPVQFIYFQF